MDGPRRHPFPIQRALVVAAALLLLGPALSAAAPTGVAEAGAVSAHGGTHLPTPKGEVVTIKEDRYDVPHVYADTTYGLFYGNGYVEAQDRLFQMAIIRHIALGDSASFLGPGQLSSDLAVSRDLYTREELAQQIAEAPPDAQAAIQGYSDGVNRFIQEAAARNQLPSEFAVLSHAPEPWTPVDTAATIAYLIGFFGVAGGAELDNARTLGQLEDSLGSQQAAWEALGDVSELNVTDSYPTIPAQDRTHDLGLSEEDLSPSSPTVQEQLDLAEAADGAIPWSRPADAGHSGAGGHAAVDARTYGGGAASARVDAGAQPPSAAPPLASPGEVRTFGEASGLLSEFKWGSNALLVNETHTTSDDPIMFGGPQTGNFKPSVFYEIGLHGAGYDVTGVSTVTTPGVVIGRTPDLAWSVTSGIDDQVDTVALELDPDDRHRYRWDGEWRRMDCREEVHRVRATPASLATGGPVEHRVVVQEVCRAEGEMPVVAWNPDENVAWAQKRTTWMEDADSAALWLRLDKRNSIEGFKETLGDFDFTFNFNVAGHDKVAYLHTGHVPDRDDRVDPRLPRPAGSEYAWEDEILSEDLGTWAQDPSTGYYAQWNNAPVEGWTSGDNRYQWSGMHRVETLDHFVQRKLQEDDGTPGEVDRDDVADLVQLAAEHDPFARHIVPHVLGATSDDSGSHYQDVRDALTAWQADDYKWADEDGDGVYDHPAHAIWDELARQLLDRVLGDELGDGTPTLQFEPSPGGHAADHGPLTSPLILLEEALAGEASHDWCDDVTTTGDETCEEIVDEAVEATHAKLRSDEGFGTHDVDAWTRPIHTTKFLPLGAQSDEEIPMVNRGSWNQVVALGEGLEASGGVNPPGQTGLMTFGNLVTGEEPENMTNQLPIYEDFGYKPLPVTDGQVEQVQIHQEQLVVPGIPHAEAGGS